MDAEDTSSSFDVYTGVWTNWSRGPIFGATLTLSRDNGNLLIAFLAFFVTVVGTRFWRIVCFALHYAFSSRKPEDGVHHQRQALLRNSGTALAGLVTLCNLLWAWRRISTSKRLCSRILPMAAFTMLLALGFAIASGFSSRISTSTGNEVLLSGGHCNVLNYKATSLPDDLMPLWVANSNAKDTGTAFDYAQQCYSANGTGSLQCGTFVKKRLPSSISLNAPCPFQPGLCRSENSSLVIDTGLLDSNDDWGINAPLSERIQFRQLVQCAPLNPEGYKSHFNLSSGRSYTKYDFGPKGRNNYTYVYPDDASWLKEALGVSYTSLGYTIWCEKAEWMYGSWFAMPNTDWIPRNDLFAWESSVLDICFLSANGIVFVEKTTDEWYSATRNDGVRHWTPENLTFDAYLPDEVASPLGCITKYQYCNPNLPESERCTPLAGSYDSEDLARNIFRDTAAWERFNWITQGILPVMPITMGVDTLGMRALLSSYSLRGDMQVSLPANQWQLEVENWNNIVLANMQEQFVAAVRGPKDPRLAPMYQGPETEAEKKLCANQKIRSTAYVSFSLLGLILIISLGALIALLSFVLEPLVGYILRRRGSGNRADTASAGKGQYARLDWITTETLQLQRLAHEELGYGGAWSGATDAVPVTRADEVLAVLDLEDEKHPRLMSLRRSGAGALEPEEAGDASGAKPTGDGGREDGSSGISECAGDAEGQTADESASSRTDSSGTLPGRPRSVSPLAAEEG